MTRITTVAILLAAVPGLAAAQQPDHIAVNGLAAFYADADPHLGTGVSRQKHVGRNWALNVEYDFTTTGLTADRHHAHSDHLLWLGVAKSFGPSDQSVPYLVMGGAGLYRHTLHDTTGFLSTLGVGVGLAALEREPVVVHCARGEAADQRALYGVGGVRVSSLTPGRASGDRARLVTVCEVEPSRNAR